MIAVSANNFQPTLAKETYGKHKLRLKGDKNFGRIYIAFMLRSAYIRFFANQYVNVP